MPLSRSECQQYVSDRFEPLVNENDLVAPNSKVWSDTYVVLDNKKVSLNFYKSSNPEALFVDDGGVDRPVHRVERRHEGVRADAVRGGAEAGRRRAVPGLPT